MEELKWVFEGAKPFTVDVRFYELLNRPSTRYQCEVRFFINASEIYLATSEMTTKLEDEMVTKMSQKYNSCFSLFTRGGAKDKNRRFHVLPNNFEDLYAATDSIKRWFRRSHDLRPSPQRSPRPTGSLKAPPQMATQFLEDLAKKAPLNTAAPPAAAAPSPAPPRAVIKPTFRMVVQNAPWDLVGTLLKAGALPVSGSEPMTLHFSFGAPA